MRFLIAPNLPTAYDRRMVGGLATALRECGQDALALQHPLREAETAARCAELGVDVLLQINRAPPVDPPLPARTRHIAWFQDVFPQTAREIAGRVRSTDIVYTLGDAETLGLDQPLPCRIGCLLTGIDASDRATAGRARPEIDFSLCGYIPPPLPQSARSLLADVAWSVNGRFGGLPPVAPSLHFRALRFLLRRGALPHPAAPALHQAARAVERGYRPLRGELDVRRLAALVREAVDAALAESGQRPSSAQQAALDFYLDNLVREYPRMLDRLTLARMALEVSASLELYGRGWERHALVRGHHRGFLSSPDELAAVYRSSRINLGNNTHGLGLHSRTFECMAVGGFVFVHASPNDSKPGGILTAFEPAVHFGHYTPENFAAEAARWLADKAHRSEAAMRAATRVRADHTWRHRALQIVGDLGR